MFMSSYVLPTFTGFCKHVWTLITQIKWYIKPDIFTRVMLYQISRPRWQPVISVWSYKVHTFRGWSVLKYTGSHSFATQPATETDLFWISCVPLDIILPFSTIHFLLNLTRHCCCCCCYNVVSIQKYILYILDYNKSIGLNT